MPHYLIEMVQRFENKNNNIKNMHTVMTCGGGGTIQMYFFHSGCTVFFLLQSNIMPRFVAVFSPNITCSLKNRLKMEVKIHQ